MNKCYSLWRTNENGTVSIIRQGCWQNNDNLESCNQTTCSSKGPLTDLARTGHNFCCCTGDFCNAKFISIKPVRLIIISSQYTSNSLNYFTGT